MSAGSRHNPGVVVDIRGDSLQMCSQHRCRMSIDCSSRDRRHLCGALSFET